LQTLLAGVAHGTGPSGHGTKQEEEDFEIHAPDLRQQAKAKNYQLDKIDDKSSINAVKRVTLK
jgi:hypothetical protein